MNKLAAMYIITGLLLYTLGAALLSTDNNLLSVAAFVSGMICFTKARKEQDEI